MRVFLIRHRGFTLIEVIVVVAILATMIGLLLPAIQKVRDTAIRAKSINNVRQINLGMHQIAVVFNGRLPACDSNRASLNWKGDSPYELLLPYVGFPNFDYTAGFTWIQVYTSPADPTVQQPADANYASYPLNAQVFRGDPWLTRSIPDGLSSTLFVAEHYTTHCGGPATGTIFQWTIAVRPFRSDGHHRADFADGGPGIFEPHSDVYPISDPATGVTRASVPGKTFQVRPTPIYEGCDPTIPQTPHPGGMIVGMGDGSVRTVRPGVGETVFWGLVTPAGGEVIGDW